MRRLASATAHHHTDARPDALLDDHALEQYVKELAVLWRVDGRAKLIRRRRDPIRGLSQRVAQFAAQSTAQVAGMEWLIDNTRIVEAVSGGLDGAGSPVLPAILGIPRVYKLLLEMVRHSDAHITQERLMRVLHAFDEVQGLTMDELWAVPTALRMALVKAYGAVADRVLTAQQERAQSEKWMLMLMADGQGAGLENAPKSTAFYERVLHLLHEQDAPEARDALEAYLNRQDLTAQQVIRLEHEQQAIDRLWLGNIMSSLRMLDGLNWEACFCAISRTEIMLCADPAGIYPKMDKESRARIRGRVKKIAQAARVGELALARNCVEAASGQEGVRAHVGWWLYDRQGLSALVTYLGLPKRIAGMAGPPDPKGTRLMVSVSAVTLILCALAFWTGLPAWLLPLALPALWGISSALIGRIFTKAFPPDVLLKLKIDRVPEEMRTLVVVPSLLSSPRRAEDLASQLEVLGCLEKDPNIDFLLLGDFSDSTRAEEMDDEQILRTVRDKIQDMNRRAGREKYFSLNRPRTFHQGEKRWMGHERKRGALMALNALLTQGGGEFYLSSAVEKLPGRYTYVITLDADTRVLPGELQKLIGAIAYPLNAPRKAGEKRAGYAVLQPRMEMPADGVLNPFIQLFGGQGGIDTYTTAVSDLYQDVCGQGIFSGKGIYHIQAFDRALAGRLPQGAILSHDLIEGCYAGAGFVSDVTFYDGHPSTFRAYLKRQHRWTRGDWQLLPFLGRTVPAQDGVQIRSPLKALDRYKMIDNLRRSLVTPFSLVLAFLGGWLALPMAAVWGSLGMCIPILSAFPRIDRRVVKQTALRISLWPEEAASLMDAVARTLWRVFVSKAHMLEWVTAADAERQKSENSMANSMAVILLLPVLKRPEWIPFALVLGIAWLLGPTWARQLEAAFPAKNGPEDRYRDMLFELAQSTWAFFAQYVPMSGNGLPPDNVQLNPPVGTARRTSPTNIGMYLCSVVSAHELGLIPVSEMYGRMSECMDTLEKLERFEGHLYNWYDIDSLAPLRPRYISSVDSGNLLAGLMLCSQALQKISVMDGVDEAMRALAARMKRFGEEMRFEVLYNRERKLFAIGIDGESGRISASHYDLLASESRILSYVAMMKGDVPVSHFKHLGRPCARVSGGQALLSWSGTMFEYLMPDLFLTTAPNTLISTCNQAVVASQKDDAYRGKNGPLPWGVSESGYYAFDLQMNYQYRAFGLPQLSMRGEEWGQVIAPYASVLALGIKPNTAARNIEHMKKLGWMGQFGLYEAVDVSPARIPEDAEYRIVYSHMAHHQGMVLCAIANALMGGALRAYFREDPRARALELLLQEKPSPKVRLRRRHCVPVYKNRHKPAPVTGRAGRPGRMPPDTHILFGAGSTLFYTASGGGYLSKQGIMANRWRPDAQGDVYGPFVFVEDAKKKAPVRVTGHPGHSAPVRQRVVLDVGIVKITTQFEEIESTATLSLSPEDGTLNQHIELTNRGQGAKTLNTYSFFEVALSALADDMAHPAFQNLFVESERVAPNALCFRRRAREEHALKEVLAVSVSGMYEGEPLVETDRQTFLGREGAVNMDALRPKFTGSTGPVLDPCAALSVKVVLTPGQTKRITFSTAILSGEEAVKGWIEQYDTFESVIRSEELAATQARAMLKFLGISNLQHQLFQRSAALLMYPGIEMPHQGPALWENNLDITGLWGLGISGDCPIVTVRISNKQQLSLLREALRFHEFLTNMGLWFDLVLINDYGNDYEQPVRDGMREIALASHAHEWIGRTGGIHMVESASVSSAQMTLLTAASRVVIQGGDQEFYKQLSGILKQVQSDRGGRGRAETGVIRMPYGLKAKENGWGSMGREGRSYEIWVQGKNPTPAPWCNVLSNNGFGAIVSERGGGYTWASNSREYRVTDFTNDVLREGFSERFSIWDVAEGRLYPVLPLLSDRSEMLATHMQGATRFQGRAGEMLFDATAFVDFEWPVKCMQVILKNPTDRPMRCIAAQQVSFIMGVHLRDLQLVKTSLSGNVALAKKPGMGMGYLTAGGGKIWADALGADKTDLPDWLPEHIFFKMGTQGMQPYAAVYAYLEIPAGEQRELTYLLGLEADEEGCIRRAESFLAEGGQERLQKTLEMWEGQLSLITVNTPSETVNAMVNRWMPYQALASRIWGRSGFYQSGGAYGFRDQLQDMLGFLYIDPQMVREHILMAAEHQFLEGDVQHWWHPPRKGVRTRISDDLLFLPYVTAAYVLETQDRQILEEMVPYLENVDIPEGREDYYGAPGISPVKESLYQHCMRAFVRASRFGEHGLPLMGTGDWNDGMNRVGAQGKGESVWLAEFMIVTLRQFAKIAEEGDRDRLLSQADQLANAVESHGWDGDWYRRAYFDNGSILGGQGSPECRIDAISQSWAALAELDPERVKKGMQALWHHLVDERHQLMRLLYPPFDGAGSDPGYIRGYVPGVRENGGQYTHAAAWAVMAYAKLGDAGRAWKLYQMLMPPAHARTEEQARVYKVEPYVIAADVYACPPHQGRGGWTWYTGSASWMQRVAIYSLLGFERTENRVRLNALLDDGWNECSVEVRYGSSAWTLTARRGIHKAAVDGAALEGEYVELVDDGQAHVALFPPRQHSALAARKDNLADAT